MMIEMGYLTNNLCGYSHPEKIIFLYVVVGVIIALDMPPPFFFTCRHDIMQLIFYKSIFFIITRFLAQAKLGGGSNFIITKKLNWS
jgi:hypothetical protein